MQNKFCRVSTQFELDERMKNIFRFAFVLFFEFFEFFKTLVERSFSSHWIMNKTKRKRNWKVKTETTRIEWKRSNWTIQNKKKRQRKSWFFEIFVKLNLKIRKIFFERLNKFHFQKYSFEEKKRRKRKFRFFKMSARLNLKNRKNYFERLNSFIF